jgi:UDP-N-acetylglucosamine 2-epimerase (non-hydrolysing)
MLEPILAELDLRADEHLQVMQPGQGLVDLSARVLTATRDLLARKRPRALVGEGDTTSVAMGALAAYYEGVGVAHVEAGLRTGDKRNPFPEEANRRLVACVADLHFAPTERARDNLLREGVDPATVHLVGNTVIDALFHARDHLVSRLRPEPALDAIPARPRRLILVTAHRRESFGPDLRAICEGLRRLARALVDEIEIVYPVHLNPQVDGPVREALGGIDTIHLTAPLGYLRFVQLLLRAALVITDSGGVQEEAAALGIPLLVARWTSERMEAVEAGVAEMVGPDAERILVSASRLLRDPEAYARRARPTSAFGDGRAAPRIAQALLRAFA